MLTAAAVSALPNSLITYGSEGLNQPEHIAHGSLNPHKLLHLLEVVRSRNGQDQNTVEKQGGNDAVMPLAAGRGIEWLSTCLWTWGRVSRTLPCDSPLS